MPYPQTGSLFFLTKKIHNLAELRKLLTAFFDMTKRCLKTEDAGMAAKGSKQQETLERNNRSVGNLKKMAQSSDFVCSSSNQSHRVPFYQTEECSNLLISSEVIF